MDILDFCPNGFTLRDNQISILKQVQAVWNKSNVIVIPAPTGSGKSLIALTIAKYLEAKGESTAIITPKVALQDQYNDTFPYVPTLKGRSRYKCSDGLSCADHYDIFESYCKECPYKKSKAAVEKSKKSIYNFHSYIYSKDYKDNLIIDEAHNIYSIMSDMFTTKIWKHQHNYPDDINEIGDVAIWMEKVIKDSEAKMSRLERSLGKLRFSKTHNITDPTKQKSVKDYLELKKNVEKYRTVMSGLRRAPTNFFIELKEEMYRGKMKECLLLRPTTLHDMPEILWPATTTKKIVMMSGTINSIDMRYMGLGGKKISFIDVINPIPKENRPIIVDNAVNMAYKYQDKNLPKLVDKIHEIMDKHPNKKGLIHTTYGIAAKLKSKLKSDRIMWHTKENKEDVLKSYMNSNDNKVLIACGFSEGVDLHGADYEFQIITKIQWPSKEDKLINFMYNYQIDRILWETVRITIQQAGRICRGADDYGVTYIVDSAFGNVAKKRRGLIDQTFKFWDKAILEAIKFI